MKAPRSRHQAPPFAVVGLLCAAVAASCASCSKAPPAPPSAVASDGVPRPSEPSYGAPQPQYAAPPPPPAAAPPTPAATPATAGAAAAPTLDIAGSPVGQELAALDAAESEIDRVLGGPKDQLGADDEREKKKEAPRAAAGDAPAGPKSAGRSGATNACGTACGALASMERAATHLCALTGEADTRCAGARSRLRAATDRVHASCPVCPTSKGG